MQCIDMKRITFHPKGLPRKISKFMPCGKCTFCIDRKRKEWYVRLYHELKGAQSALFLTLTYNDENLHVWDPDLKRSFKRTSFMDFYELTVVKEHLQKFVKDVKRHKAYFDSNERSHYKKTSYYDFAYKNQQEYSKWPPVRYYGIGEYGGMFGRPHYHVLLFNYPIELSPKLIKIWNRGFVHQGTVTQKSIRYVTQYMFQKITHNNQCAEPFMICSLGIGKNYVHDKTKGLITHIDGNKYSLPRYYRSKIYDKWETLRMQTDARKRADDFEDKRIRELSRYTDNPYKRRLEEIEAKRLKIERSLTKKSKRL